MLTTIDKFSSTGSLAIVPDMVKAIQSLKTDDQLGLLWVLYENMGGLVTPADSSATERIQLAGGFVCHFGGRFIRQLDSFHFI